MDRMVWIPRNFSVYSVHWWHHQKYGTIVKICKRIAKIYIPIILQFIISNTILVWFCCCEKDSAKKFLVHAGRCCSILTSCTRYHVLPWSTEYWSSTKVSRAFEIGKAGFDELLAVTAGEFPQPITISACSMYPGLMRKERVSAKRTWFSWGGPAEVKLSKK